MDADPKQQRPQILCTQQWPNINSGNEARDIDDEKQCSANDRQAQRRALSIYQAEGGN
jgi:hypothetical protein